MGFIFNFLKRIIKISIKLSLYLAVFATLIVLIPNLPPYTKFTSIELAPTQPRVGPLTPNDALNNAEQRYKGKLLGPEAFQISNGELYTSLATGEIVKISPGGHVTFVTKVGQPCTGLSKEHICGRPLGFQIDDNSKTLYVADAYHGIWKVDLKTDKKQLLVSPHKEIGDRQPRIFNSIALEKNGNFYWSDSSSDFQLKDGAMTLLTDPSGRVFYYDASKNESKVVVDDLWFANGLVLSPNNEFLVISETAQYRLMKHYIAGPKKGNTEVFVDGLPGTPDNVRVLPDGSGLLVGMYTIFDDEQPLLTRSLSSTPAIRKFLARLQRLIEIPFEYLNTLYPHVVFEDIVYHIGHFRSVSGFSPSMCGVIQVDWNGNVVASYLNTDKSLGHISDAIVYNDKLYTGSAHVQDFIGAVPVPPLLKKAFESPKKAEAPKVEIKSQQAKPVEQTKPKAQEPPKAAPKPKVEPKVETKPKTQEKVQPKLKVEEKPKAETKPKVQEKKDAPKPAKVDVKPPQPAKPVETAKPNVAKASPQQPKTTPPPTPTKPPVKQEPPKQAPPAPEQRKPTTTKPEVKTNTTPKPAEKTTPQTPKPTTKAPEEPKKTQKPDNSKPQAKAKEQIPIKEEIPADTTNPPKEKLKVIRKGGVPTEMPVPV